MFLTRRKLADQRVETADFQFNLQQMVLQGTRFTKRRWQSKKKKTLTLILNALCNLSYSLDSIDFYHSFLQTEKSHRA